MLVISQDRNTDIELNAHTATGLAFNIKLNAWRIWIQRPIVATYYNRGEAISAFTNMYSALEQNKKDFHMPKKHNLTENALKQMNIYKYKLTITKPAVSKNEVSYKKTYEGFVIAESKEAAETKIKTRNRHRLQNNDCKEYNIRLSEHDGVFQKTIEFADNASFYGTYK